MIESAMIAALGAIAATLLFLLVLPFINRRSRRLVQRQLEWRLPASPAEIGADRDLLRAEIAMRERVAEQQIEKARNAVQSEQMETGRKLIDIQARQENIRLLETDLRRMGTEAEALRAELSTRNARILDLDAALAAELTRATAFATALDRTNQDLQAAVQLAEERRVEIGTMEAQSAAQKMRISDAESDVSRTRAILAERSESMRALERKLRDAQSEFETATKVRLRAETLAEERLLAIRQLEQKRDGLMIERDKLVAELAREVQTRKSLEDEIERRAEASHRLDSELAAVRNAGVQTTSELAKRMGELSAERQARKTGEQTLRDTERRLSAAETRHASILQAREGSGSARLAALETELRLAIQREADLQQQLDTLRRQTFAMDRAGPAPDFVAPAPPERKPRTAAQTEPSLVPPPASNDSNALPESDPRLAIAEMRHRLRKKLEQASPMADRGAEASRIERRALPPGE